MDKTDKTLGRREFMVAVGGVVVAAGCGEAADGTAPVAPAAGAAPAVPAAAGGPALTATAPVVVQAPVAAGSAAPQLPAAAPSVTPPPAAPAAPVVTPPAAMSSSPVTGGAPASPAAAGAGGAGAKPAAASGKARIYVVKASDRKAGIEQALSMFGGMGFAGGRDVVLKPNFNSQYAFPATTHDDTIRTVVGALKSANAGKITLGESSGATTGSATPTATVLQMKNAAGLCKDLGIELLSYDDPSVEWESFMFDGMTWSGGLAIPKLMRSDRVKILMPCCKTHTLGDFTCSIKLAAGLPQRNRRGLISDMHTNLQEKVADINKGFTPDLIVMDATRVFIDGGPDSGTTADPGLIVVGTDRIALDAVGVAILKYAGSVSGPISGKIFSTRQLARAIKIGLHSTKSPDDIELVGNDNTVISKLRSILDMG